MISQRYIARLIEVEFIGYAECPSLGGFLSQIHWRAERAVAFRCG